MPEFRAVWNRPGLFKLPSEGYPQAFPGLFSLGDLVEDPEGSGLYPFVTIGATIPPVTAVPGDGTTAPYVDVLIDFIPDEVDRVTVWRQSDNRWFPVRPAIGVRNVGAWTGRDYEAAFDRTLTYRVQYYQEDGTTLGFSDPATVTLTGPGENWVWVHNPLDPSTALKVAMVDGFAASLNRPTTGSMLYPTGRSTGNALPGIRRSLQNINLDVYTTTTQDAETFDRMVGGYDDNTLPILCYRALKWTWLPGTLFAFVDATLEPHRTYGITYDVIWRVTGDECAPPVASVITPDLTLGDFEDAYATYGEFEDAYQSYLEAERDYTVITG